MPGRVVNAYKGAIQNSLNTPAVFNHTEDFGKTGFRIGDVAKPFALGRVCVVIGGGGGGGGCMYEFCRLAHVMVS